MKGEAGVLKVGWASREIVPDGPVALRGQFYERISKYVRDPLTVTALALEQLDAQGAGRAQAVLVSCDLSTVTRPLQQRVRAEVGARVPGLDTGCIVLFATHTHTAPFCAEALGAGAATTASPYAAVRGDLVSPAAYFALLVRRISEAVEEAWNARAVGGVSAATEIAVTGSCRLAGYRDGSVRMYGNTQTADFEGILGPSDPNLEMLFFWDADRRPTGALLNACCPAQVVEHQSFVSADYWSEVRKEIRHRLGSGFFVLPAAGAAGDQSPRDLVRLRRGAAADVHESPLNSHLPVADTTWPGWEMYDERGLVIIGERIAAAVDRAYPRAAAGIRTDAELRHARKLIQLPLRRVSAEEHARASEQCGLVLARHEIQGSIDDLYTTLPSRVREEVFPAYGIVRRYRLQQTRDFFETEIHAVRIGDSAIVTNPFELYLEYGLRMRARCSAKQLLIVQLATDEGYYLPTERAIRGGSYSAIVASNLVGPEGGTLLVGHSVELVDSLF